MGTTRPLSARIHTAACQAPARPAPRCRPLRCQCPASAPAPAPGPPPAHGRRRTRAWRAAAGLRAGRGGGVQGARGWRLGEIHTSAGGHSLGAVTSGYWSPSRALCSMHCSGGGVLPVVKGARRRKRALVFMTSPSAAYHAPSQAQGIRGSSSGGSSQRMISLTRSGGPQFWREGRPFTVFEWGGLGGCQAPFRAHHRSRKANRGYCSAARGTQPPPLTTAQPRNCAPSSHCSHAPRSRGGRLGPFCALRSRRKGR